MKNTGGIAIFYGPTFVSAQTNTQRFITTSSGEAELRQASLASKQIVFYKGFLEECGCSVGKIGLLIDSKASISTINFPISKRLKFLSLYVAFIKELVARAHLLVLKVSRDVNVADFFTRQDAKEVFWKFIAYWKRLLEGRIRLPEGECFSHWVSPHHQVQLSIN